VDYIVKHLEMLTVGTNWLIYTHRHNNTLFSVKVGTCVACNGLIKIGLSIIIHVYGSYTMYKKQNEICGYVYIYSTI